MAGNRKRKKLGAFYLLCAGGLVLTVVACVLYAQRDHLLIHYHADRYLADKSGADASGDWLLERKVISVPVLLESLSSSTPLECERASDLLEKVLAEHADPTSPDHSQLSLAMAAHLHKVYLSLPATGRNEAVHLTALVLKTHLTTWSPKVSTAIETAGDVFLKGLVDEDVQVKANALDVLATIWTWNGADNIALTLVEEWRRHCYDRAVHCLTSASPRIRAAAAEAISHSPLHEGDPMLIGLLNDPDPGVQKVALVALAKTAADSLTSQQKVKLMDFLHDSDPEVRAAAANLLRHSGLSDAIIHLATLIKHPEATERAKVVHLAFSVPDVDPVQWIMSLADDPAPAVRIAIAQEAARSDNTQLRQQLFKMSESDPDPLVREMSQQLIANLPDRPAKR